MKKRKLVYLLSIAPLALSLASCDTRDYMAKDFDFKIPERDSKATVEYDMSDYDVYLDTNTKMGNVCGPAYKNLQNDYAAFMLTERVSNEYIDYSLVQVSENKYIVDFKNKSFYYYKHYYELEEEKVSSECSIETKVYLAEENTFRVDTEINLNNYEFGTKKTRRYATGSKKITTLSKPKGDFFDYSTQNSTSYFQALPIQQYFIGENTTLYASEDFNYWYYSMNSEEDVPRRTMIAEKGLTTYYYQDHIYKSGDDFKNVEKQKYEYFDHSILNAKYDNTGYTEYNEEILTYMGLTPSFFVPSSSAFDGLIESDVFETWFTVSEKK